MEFLWSLDIFRSPGTDRSSREEHSRKLDELLEFDIPAIEQRLLDRAKSVRPDGHLWSLGQGIHGGSQTWVGLDHQMLQTPYDEIREMFELISLSGVKKVIDLGAGYGRMGIFLHALDPEINFTGHELVSERVEEGNRIYQKYNMNAELLVQDLTSDFFVMPEAQVYFIYDFGEVSHIRKILNQLGELSDKKFALIARGKGTRALVDLEYPWLSDVKPVIRKENFAIYLS